MTYLDTHVVVWLYRRDVDLLSPKALHRIEEDDLLLSPMVLLELEYLAEIHKERPSALTVLGELERNLGLRVCDLPFPSVARQALEEKWGRDPFDRLIVAQARASHSHLITKDAKIRRNYDRAVW